MPELEKFNKIQLSLNLP